MAEIARDALYRLARHLLDEGMTHEQVTSQLEKLHPGFREFMVEATLADGRTLWVKNPRTGEVEATSAPVSVQSKRKAKQTPRRPRTMTSPLPMSLAGGMLASGGLGLYWTRLDTWQPELGLPMFGLALAFGGGWLALLRAAMKEARRAG